MRREPPVFEFGGEVTLVRLTLRRVRRVNLQLVYKEQPFPNNVSIFKVHSLELRKSLFSYVKVA